MIKQNPFSLYDFFGYFIPGALTVYIILFSIKANDLNNVDQLSLILNDDNTFQIENFLFFIIISYSIGHLINFTSSITIERYANWKYNYPSKYLLGFSKGFKFWENNDNKKIKFWKFLLILLLFPVTFLDYILGELFGFKMFYTKKADEYIIDSTKSKGIILFNQLGTPSTKNLRDYDFHRIFSHYVYENSKNHQSRLSNYVALYGFLRSLCLISVLFIWLLIFKLIRKSYLYFSFNDYYLKCKYLIFYFLLISISSYVFFMAFMKFYRRYTLENFMLIVIDKDLVDRNNPRQKIKKEPKKDS